MEERSTMACCMDGAVSNFVKLAVHSVGLYQDIAQRRGSGSVQRLGILTLLPTE